jgi:hypothetical protein
MQSHGKARFVVTLLTMAACALARGPIVAAEAPAGPATPPRVLLRSDVVAVTDSTAVLGAVIYNPGPAPIRCSLRIRALGEGWKPRASADATWEAEAGWSLGPPIELSRPVPVTERVRLGRLSGSAGDVTAEADAFVEPQFPLAIGQQVGWITGADDPLAKAARALGIHVEAIPDLQSADLTAYRSIIVGDGAFSHDWAHVGDASLRLQQFAACGGKVIVGQISDENWSLNLLPYDLVVENGEAVSGAIVYPTHPLFNTPNELRDLRGVKSERHIALTAGRWQALIRDSEHRPTVVEAPFGKGRFLVIIPGFDREVGLEKPENPDIASRCEAFIRNLMAYALSG